MKNCLSKDTDVSTSNYQQHPLVFPQPNSRGPPSGVYWPASREWDAMDVMQLSSSAVNFLWVTLANQKAPFHRQVPPPASRGGAGDGRGGVTYSIVTTLGLKMAAETGGRASSSASGRSPSRWYWSGSLWVRGVLLLLGGLRASATSIPVSLGSSPPCRHHVPSESEVGRRRGPVRVK